MLHGGSTWPLAQSSRTCSPLCSANLKRVWAIGGVTIAAALPPWVVDASLAPILQETFQRTLVWQRGRRSAQDNNSSLTLVGRAFLSPSLIRSIQMKVSCNKHIIDLLCMKGCTRSPVMPCNNFRVTTGSLHTLTSSEASCCSLNRGAPTRPRRLSTSVPQATKVDCLSKALWAEVGMPWFEYCSLLCCMITSSLNF